MIVGITGTRHGCTLDQLYRLTDRLKSLGATELHHGDCCGADSQAHDIARRLELLIVGHPPIDDKLRAFRKCDIMREPKDYLIRNRDIVNESDFLIALPFQNNNVARGSGTWYTIRYARKVNCPLQIIAPE